MAADRKTKSRASSSRMRESGRLALDFAVGSTRRWHVVLGSLAEDCATHRKNPLTADFDELFGKLPKTTSRRPVLARMRKRGCGIALRLSISCINLCHANRNLHS